MGYVLNDDGTLTDDALAPAPAPAPAPPPPDAAPVASAPPPDAAPTPPANSGYVMNDDGSVTTDSAPPPEAAPTPAPSPGYTMADDGSIATPEPAPAQPAAPPKVYDNTPSPGDLLGMIGGGLKDAFQNGPGGALDRANQVSDAARADILAHPEDAVWGVKDAIGAALGYGQANVSQHQVTNTVQQIEGTAPPPPVTLLDKMGAGLQQTLDNITQSTGALNLDQMSPELKTQVVDAYHNGYTTKDGAIINPGPRAAWQAYEDSRTWVQQLGDTTATDPLMLAGGVSTLLKAGGLSRAGLLGLKGAEEAGPLSSGLGEAIDTVSTAGLNKIVPGVFDLAGKAGKATGILAPSKATVLRQATDALGDTGGELVQGLNETGQRAVTRGAGQLRDLPGNVHVIEDQAGQDLLAYKTDAAGKLVGVVDNPTTARNVVRPMTPADDDKALRLLTQLPDQTYLKASKPLLGDMLDRRALETKLPITNPADPRWQRYEQLMAGRVANWDKPGALTGLSSDYTNRPVLEAMMRSLDWTNQHAKVLPDLSLEAEREHAGIQQILQRASQQSGVNHLDDWARGELAAIGQHGFRTPALDRALAARGDVFNLVHMPTQDFWGTAGTQARRGLFQAGQFSNDPAAGTAYDNLLNLYRDRLGDPTMRAAELNSIADHLEPLLAGRGALTTAQTHTANHLITVLQSEGVTAASLDQLVQAARDAGNTWRAPGRVFGNLTRGANVAGNPEVATGIFRSIWNDPIERDLWRSLPDETKAALHEPLTVGGSTKEVWQSVKDHQAHLDQVSRWAKLQANGAEIGRTAELDLERTVKRIATLNHSDTPQGLIRARQLLVDAGDKEVDNLALRVTQQDYLIGQGALTATGKPIVQKGLSAKAMQGLDAYLNARRAVQLLNPVHGPYYVMQQAAGNALSLLLAKPAALADYFNPVEWKKTYNVLKRGADVAFDDLPRAMQMETKFGGRMNDVVSATRSEAMLGWFHQPNRSPLVKALGKVLAPEPIFRGAATWDADLRAAVYTAVMDPALKKLERDLPDAADLVRSRSFPGAPIAKPDIERAIQTAFKDHGPFPTQMELRDAIYQAGGAEQSARAADLFKYSDRVSRDYWAQIKPLQKLAREEVDRIGFTGGETNADAVLKKFFMFHYWVSRATKLYAVEAAKNPAQLSLWSHAMELSDQRTKADGVPPWQRAWVEFMKTPAGFTTSFDPTSLLGTYLFFADGMQGGDSKQTLTPIGDFFQNGLGSNLMLNPLLQGTFGYVLGYFGKDAQPPDLFGTQKIETEANYALKFAFQQVNGYRGAHGMEPLAEPPTFDSKVLLNGAAQELSGLLLGSQAVNIYDPAQSLENTVGWQVRHNLLQQDPNLKNDPDSLEEAVNYALTHHDSPTYQDALGQVVDAHYDGPLSDKGGWWRGLGYVARASSPLTMSTVPTEKEAYYLRKGTDYDPAKTGLSGMETANVKELDKTTNAALYAGTGRDRDLAMAQNQYFNGDFLVGSIIKQQNPTASPEQIKALTEQALSLPDDPAKAQARQIQGIMDQAAAIRGASTTAPITVLGQTLSPEQLTHVDPEQRGLLAQQWIDEQGYRDASDQYYAARKQYLADNPDLAGSFALKNLADQYGGGRTQFIADARAANPNYARFLDQIDPTIPPGSDEWSKIALGSDAYLSLTGLTTGAYSQKPIEAGKGLVPGLPVGQSLAEWSADHGDSTDPTFAKRQAQLQDDLGGVDQIVQFLNSYDPSGASTNQYLYKAATGGGFLNTAAYNAVKAKFGYVLPSSDSEVDRYLQYLGDGGDGSVDGYFSWSSAQSRQKKLAGGIVLHADVQPAQAAAQDSTTGQNGDLSATLKASGLSFGRDGAGNLQLLSGAAPKSAPTTAQAPTQPAGGTASGLAVTPLRSATYQTDDGRTGTLPVGIRLVALGPKRGNLMQVQAPGGGTVWVRSTDLQRVA